MFETRRHDDDDRRADRLDAAFQQRIALATENVQDLQKGGMTVQADFKAVQAATRKKRLAMEAKIGALRGFFPIKPFIGSHPHLTPLLRAMVG